MCGLIGSVTKKKKSIEVIQSSLGLLNHRGPDHAGYEMFFNSERNVLLGHTRLSIIDLSDSANQPFNSPCGDYSLVYNGEIYNYKEIRLELKNLGHQFFTESDTEVLMVSLIEWGYDCLNKMVGMFSFAFFNRITSEVILARDAFGIKPLFYYLNGGEFYFASELPALLKLRESKGSLNLQVAYNYLVHGDYDSVSSTFVADIYHLPQACVMAYDLKTGTSDGPIKWWEPSITTNNEISFEETTRKCRELFLASVKLHLRSDVPLGVALSGGIDSSSLVFAVRYLQPDINLHTFSYIASGHSFSEEAWIDKVNLKTEAIDHKVIATHRDLATHLDEMLSRQGEPFGGTSLYAQYRVFKLAKAAGITVTLDGQGADELLAGYNGYPGYRLLSLLETEGFLAAHLFAKRWGGNVGRSYLMAWGYLLKLVMPNWLYRFARAAFGRNFKPKWLDGKILRKHGVRLEEARPRLDPAKRGNRVKEALAASLSGRGLPALLRHGDRNSMAFSIESRVPFLTIALADFLLSLPESFLISSDGTTKHVFREAMRGLVPDEILDRPDKIGFETPESEWLMSAINDVRHWIKSGPELEFISRGELLNELSLIEENKRLYDKRVWRWLNYLKWCSLTEISYD